VTVEKVTAEKVTPKYSAGTSNINNTGSTSLPHAAKTITYEASIRLEGKTLTVNSTRPLAVGQKLELQWKNDQTLRVLNSNATNSPSDSTHESTGLHPTNKPTSEKLLTDLARQVLAHQQNPNSLMTTLSHIAKALAGQISGIQPTGILTTSVPTTGVQTAIDDLKQNMKSIVDGSKPLAGGHAVSSGGKNAVTADPSSLAAQKSLAIEKSTAVINLKATAPASSRVNIPLTPHQRDGARETSRIAATNTNFITTSKTASTKAESQGSLPQHGATDSKVSQAPPMHLNGKTNLPLTSTAINLLQQLRAILDIRINVDTGLSQTNPSNIKAALNSSGLFFEKGLSDPRGTSPHPDLKTALGELFHTLRSLKQQAGEINNTKNLQAKATSQLDSQVSVNSKPLNQSMNTPNLESNRLFERSLKAAIQTLVSAGTTTKPNNENHISQTISSSLKLITQTQLLQAAQHRSELSNGHLTSKDMQAFAHFLLTMMRPETQNQKPKANDRNEQIFQALMKNIASVIFKIQLNQLSSLPQTSEEGTQSHSWQFDLPLFCQQQNESVQVRIHKDDKGASNDSGESQLVWRVCLDFDFESLGAMHAELLMQKEDARATLWSEKLSTFHKTQQQLYQLQQSLHSLGFSAVNVVAEHGIPKKTQQPPIKRSLIDVRT